MNIFQWLKKLRRIPVPTDNDPSDWCRWTPNVSDEQPVDVDDEYRRWNIAKIQKEQARLDQLLEVELRLHGPQKADGSTT